jgi:vacuolar-type H+-ATPase subunit F/Vma7
MAAPVYLGDEFSAAGYRLAGADVQVPAAGDATGALTRACAQAPLVLVSAALVARIDPATLRAASTATAPLVLVVPDPQGAGVIPDLAGRLRRELGLDA